MPEKKRSPRKVSVKKAPPEYCEAVIDLPALRIPTEDEEQILVINWCHSHEDRRLAMIYATPNGGWRDTNTAVKLKAAGVKAGIPDLFLPIPIWRICLKEPAIKSDFLNSLLCFISKFTGNKLPFIEIYNGLYVEMKRTKGGQLSIEQKVWIDCLRKQGYMVVVAKGHQAAIDAIKSYLFGG